MTRNSSKDEYHKHNVDWSGCTQRITFIHSTWIHVTLTKTTYGNDKELEWGNICGKAGGHESREDTQRCMVREWHCGQPLFDL